MSKTLLLLADGFEAYEASVFTDVLGWNLFEGDKSTELVSVGMQPTLHCTWGYSVAPDQQLDNIDINDFDALAIPGGFAEANFYDDAFSQTFGEVIQHFDQADKPIASICVAALALGHSGILKNRPATTYSFPGNTRQDQLAEMGAKVDCSADTVIDKNVITSSSPATALTVAYWLLEQLTDSKNVKNVKQRMGFRNQESK